MSKPRFFMGVIFSWIFFVGITFLSDYLFLEDFWQSMKAVGFARSDPINIAAPIIGLLIFLVVIYFMCKNILWLKNDARTKRYIFMMGLMYGLTFSLPLLFFNLFFNVAPIFAIVRGVTNVILFVLVAFIFVLIARFKLKKEKKID